MERQIREIRDGFLAAVEAVIEAGVRRHLAELARVAAATGERVLAPAMGHQRPSMVDAIGKMAARGLSADHISDRLGISVRRVESVIRWHRRGRG